MIMLPHTAAGDEASGVWSEVPPTADGISRLIRRARRCNVWFRTLNYLERCYLEAVARVVDVIRSPLLLRVVGRVVGKLLKAMRGLGGDLMHMMGTVGRRLAESVCRIALRWGHRLAASWVRDLGFIRYLTVMYMNRPLGF